MTKVDAVNDLRAVNQVQSQKPTGYTTKQKVLISLAIGCVLAVGAAFLANRYYGNSAPMPEVTSEPENICLTLENFKGFCSKNLGILRKDMPQIEGDMKNSFLNKLAEMKINVTKVSIQAEKFLASQSELSGNIVRGMVRSFLRKSFAPCERVVLISKDMHIIDGHHTTAACAWLKGKINALMIDWNITDVLNIAKHYSVGSHRMI